eukprot:m.175054 g.175054  ORF g.175054 m.175054 type:complete len:98 (+) comp18347_c0_seq4:183-476(+)
MPVGSVVHGGFGGNECTVFILQFTTGDSGIVAVGTADGFDGTAPTYPANNDISNNHIHEIGVYGKQTSCYFQALGQNNRFANNLCYNGTSTHAHRTV